MALHERPSGAFVAQLQTTFIQTSNAFILELESVIQEFFPQTILMKSIKPA